MMMQIMATLKTANAERAAAWFGQFAQRPNGTARHDVFARLFATIEPKGTKNLVIL
jgi:hypothetical protein